MKGTRYPSCVLGFLVVVLFVLWNGESVNCLNAQQHQVMESLLSFSSLWKQQTRNVSSDPCHWPGVTCVKDSVSAVNVSGLQFTGSAWKKFCQLDGLQVLDVSHNQLSSPSDSDFENCRSLIVLNMSNNELAGPFPFLQPSTELQSLDASQNSFTGVFGPQIKGLVELKELILNRNGLSGEIGDEIFSCRNLTSLDLSENKFQGQILESIGNFSRLEGLALSSNMFSGKIPVTVGSLVNLSHFDASENGFVGSVPEQLASLSKLQRLSLNSNKLSGTVPTKIFSIKGLLFLDLGNNQLQGSIPGEISSKLQRLDISKNRFQGPIPDGIGNLHDLNALIMNDNLLEGHVPAQLSKCSNLSLLDLTNNKLRGPLPAQLAQMEMLQVLKLGRNNFNGSILKNISSLANLTYLDLSHNSFHEELLPEIFDLQQLQNLLLQNNRLFGVIPASVKNCRSLLQLDIGGNNLNGTIPSEIGQLKNLQISLNLSRNSLENVIPTSILLLNFLEVLDLSYNKLNGSCSLLFQMNSLVVLNVSNNNLTGIIPRYRQSLTAVLSGNPFICYYNSCLSVSTGSSDTKPRVIGISIGVTVFAFLVIVLTVVLCKIYVINGNARSKAQRLVKIKGHLISSDVTHKENLDFQKTFADTYDPANLVLKSKFCTYYKSRMASGTSYLVKKLNCPENMLVSKKYENLGVELDSQDRVLKHSNIMTPLAYALHVDCAFLFYEYKYKGTLSEFLHGNNVAVLEWSSRKSLAMGVAQGVAFLHSCEQPVIHLDLTTQNIFLKSATEALIGDTELCRIIDPSKSTATVSAIAGSVGYIPPEYAYTMKVTAPGNVYSFGVVLLEILTGKPPITGGTDLAKWVQSAIMEYKSWDIIFDSKIRDSGVVKQEMTSMLKVALRCINDAPTSRPDMNAVVQMLAIEV